MPDEKVMEGVTMQQVTARIVPFLMLCYTPST
jgi:hypothetical protein